MAISVYILTPVRMAVIKKSSLNPLTQLFYRQNHNELQTLVSVKSYNNYYKVISLNKAKSLDYTGCT